MIYSSSHNFVFVHIAKTGGQSIKQALLPYRELGKKTRVARLMSKLPLRRDPAELHYPPHVSAQWLRRRIGAERFDKAFKFAIVRNPFDRLVSSYEYIRQSDWHHAHEAAKRMGFKEFLKYQKRRNLSYFRPQLYYLSDSHGKLMVDKIYRFEEFGGVLEDVCARIGIPKPESVPHKNSSKRASLASYYDEETIEMVRRNFGADLKAFGYEFPG